MDNYKYPINQFQSIDIASIGHHATGGKPAPTNNKVSMAKPSRQQHSEDRSILTDKPSDENLVLVFFVTSLPPLQQILQLGEK